VPKNSLKLLTLAICALSFGVNAQNSTVLEQVTIEAQNKDGGREQGYLSKKTKGVGLWDGRNLQDTPYAISVVSDELIENTNAKDMNQIFKMNPVTQETHSIASNATGGAWVTMRGLQISNPVINGIPYVDRVGSVPAMFELERVEIISGATGFLYGGGRVGGAVNYITKKPTPENLRTLSFGNYGGSNNMLHLDLGGQFNQAKTIGYRINGVLQNGRDARRDKKDKQNLSAVIDFNPSDELSTNVRYSYANNEQTGPTILWRDFDRAALSKKVKRNRTFAPNWLIQEFTAHKLENSVNWQLRDNLTLRTNLMQERIVRSYGDARFYFENDKVLGSNGKNSWLGKYSLTYQTKTGGSIFLDWNLETFSVAHKITAGYLYSNNLNENRNSKLANNDPEYQIQKDITLEEYQNWAKPSTWGKKAYLKDRVKSTKADMRNILLGDDLVFNDNWQALIGVNYASIMDYSYTTKVKYNKGRITPTASLLFKPSAELTTYLTYIESLEKGIIVGNTYLNEGEVFKPYVSKQYELGAKYLWQESLSINAALFRLEKANSYSLETLPLPTFTYDGRQIHQGLELSISGKLSDNLSLLAGSTWLDLEVTKTNDKNLAGKKPEGVASRMHKVYGEYSVPSLPKLKISAGAYYTGKKQASYAANYVRNKIVPSYTLFDAGMRYETSFGNKNVTSFNLNLQNITDKIYWGGTSTLGDPRTLTFSVKTNF